jgi:hypothetical protein
MCLPQRGLVEVEGLDFSDIAAGGGLSHHTICPFVKRRRVIYKPTVWSWLADEVRWQ